MASANTPIPIAIFFNVVRVTGTALLAERNPDLAMGFYHAISGWLIFVAGFAALYLAARILHAALDPKVNAAT